MGRKRDRFWDYAEELDGGFKCKSCERVSSGGATRIKSHLAGVSGHDIAACEKVPVDIQNEAYQATQGTNKKLKSASTSSNAKQSKITSASASKNNEKFVTQVFIYLAPNSMCNCLFLT